MYPASFAGAQKDEGLSGHLGGTGHKELPPHVSNPGEMLYPPEDRHPRGTETTMISERDTLGT